MKERNDDRRFLAGIQNRLVIAFLTVTMIPVVVLAIYSTRSQLRALEELAFTAAADEAALRARKLQDALGGAQRDLFYLTQLPSLNTYLESSDRAEAEDLDFQRDKLARQFSTFIASQGRYRSACYVDSQGGEVVRIRRVGTSTRIVPYAALSLQPPRDDLLAIGEHLLSGQTLTRIESTDDGPVVQFLARLFPRGAQRRGFVVLEIEISGLWEEEEGEPVASATEILLLDMHGDKLMGTDAGMGEPIREVLARQPGAPLDIGDGRIATYLPVYPDRINPTRPWSFFAIVPRADVLASLNRYRVVFTVVLVVVLLAAAGVSLLLARQFTGPLKRLYSAAQDIGHGNFDVPLEDRTGDEIGGLARELRAMADKLKLKHKDMQHQIDEKTRELLQAERLSTIGTLSAAIAHEVNNPIGIISMYGQMLLEQLPPDDPQARKIKTIVREASRMSVLVRGLLQFARRPELDIQEVSPAQLIDEAVNACGDLVEGADQVEIQQVVSGDCPNLHADPGQLGQVLRNLVRNAIQAVGGRGVVTVRCDPAGDGEHVQFEVHDTGHGIEPENLSRLFEPFFTTKRFGAGTGLGLSISREIAERHGGEISVTSSPGDGTRFRIVLPIDARPKPELAEPAGDTSETP